MDFIAQALAVAVVLSAPLLLAGLGELIAERSGVLNLGLEGVMLVGAASAAVVAVHTQNLVGAFVVGLIAGALMGTLHAFFAVGLKANQIVAGLTLAIFGAGLSSFIGNNVSGTPISARLSTIRIPVLADIPVIGEAFFNRDIVVYLAILALPAAGYFLSRTRAGAAVRACGSSPAAADAAGLPVSTIRWAATIFGGSLAGLGGAYISVAYARIWSDNLTAGRGWIALALVIFAVWRPWALLPGAIVFGFVDATNFQLQTRGVDISADWLGMMPYVVTIVVLIVIGYRQYRSGSSGGPAALSEPYSREARV